MALWQFECMIVSKENIYKDIESEEILSWDNIILPTNIKEMVEEILPYRESWSNEIFQCGETDSTCIQLYYENDRVDEINIRLDLRTIKKDTIGEIVEFIKHIGGKILYNKRIYDAQGEVLIELLRNSDAGRFCMNPKAYFEEQENTL